MVKPINFTAALREVYATAEDVTGELPESGPYFFEQVVVTLKAPAPAVRELLNGMVKSGDAKEVWEQGKKAYMFRDRGMDVLYEKAKKDSAQRKLV